MTPGGDGASEDFDSDEFREFLRERRHRQRGRDRGGDWAEDDGDWRWWSSLQSPRMGWREHPFPGLVDQGQALVGHNEGPQEVAGSHDAAGTFWSGLPHVQALGKGRELAAR